MAPDRYARRVNNLPTDAATSEDGSDSAPECPAPLDPPMVPFVVVGLAVWAVVGVAMLSCHRTLVSAGHGSWLWICLAGFLVGIPGLLAMLRHDAHRAARRAANHDAN